MTQPSNNDNQYALEIYKEKQKTIRKFISYSVILIVGVLVIFLGGKFKVSKDGIEISKDILATTKQEVEKGKDGSFTTGKLNQEGKKLIEDNKDKINAKGFTGQNYINYEHGYLFAVAHPDKWQISYHPENVGAEDSNNKPVNMIDGGDGIIYRTAIGDNDEGYDIQTIATGLYGMMAALTPDSHAQPEISYDVATKTAFFKGNNLQNGKKVLMKIILKDNKGYFAYLEYPSALESDARVTEMQEMVSTFTLI